MSKHEPPATLVNFDPAALVKKVEDACAVVDGIVSKVESVLEPVEALLRVFSPFLPAPVGTALQELPELEAEISRLKTFLGNTLQQVEMLVGNAGEGAALATGATIDGATLTPAMHGVDVTHIDGSNAGSFDNGETKAPPPKPEATPPDGMEWLWVQSIGAWALAQIPPKS